MKKLFVALLCLSFGFASTQVYAQAKKDDPNAPVFKFKHGDTYDFGTVPEGPSAVHDFEFKNTGKEPLIIQNASASCGCTTPFWPKEPILPGKKGKITVKYNTQGRVGPFRKDIYIQSNAKSDKERYELHITGTVQAKAPEAPKNGPAAK